MSEVTQSLLKELFEYNPETGCFIRRVARSNNVKVGDSAGYLDKDGYCTISISNKLYLSHRLAWLYMTGEWPKHEIDHENHIRSDNSFSNLQAATRLENSKNQTLRNTNTSGVMGVSWIKARSKWYANIMINGKTKALGRFFNLNDAIIARKMAEYKHGFHYNHGALKNA